jgi:hypothetical protein
MNAYVYPIKVNGQEILIAHDDKLVTWLNATDLVVRAGLYWFIEKHPEAGIVDLLNSAWSRNLNVVLSMTGVRSLCLPANFHKKTGEA